MRSQIKLLSLTVRATVVLLTVGAFLVVLGIFDDYLGWDVFSPEVEKLLYGLFASSVALGGFGAAICVVLGIQEVVRAFRKLVERSEPTPSANPVEATRRTYTVALAAVLVLLIVTVSALAAVNRRVEAHRLKVFKLIARDQMAQLGPHLTAELSRIPVPCETCATPGLHQFFRTLDGLSFSRSATLYVTDPADETVLWRYPSTETCSACGDKPGFERFFIARDDDRAVKLALQGDTAWIDQKNSGPGFVWHQVIRDGQGKNRAVLQIWGNESESFRDYQAVAEAAEKKGR
ncbi:MAG TPA: hypothetical protein VH394_19585 [Thermoanaerobaculia bacterium]|jgi:hypothetical protein|nr:hypothetical protein [Thermoanaerobaculia bacterium]